MPTGAPRSRERTAPRSPQPSRWSVDDAPSGAVSSLEALEPPALVSRSDVANRAPASCADSMECVMQVDEETGLDV